MIRLLDRWTGLMRRYAWLVAVIAVAASVAAAIYVARNMAINTNTVDMLSADLPFRKADRAMMAAFPRNADAVVVVVEGDTAELAEAAGNRLATGFRQRPEVFGPVFDPAGDPFFRRNGLLYLDPDRLGAVVDQLSAAQPFIGSLAGDPSLRGLFDVLSLALRNLDAADGAGGLPIAAALDDMARATHAAAAGEFAPLSWQSLMFGVAPDRDQMRRIIVLNPPLDFASLQPAAPAIAAIRALAEDLELNAAHGVSVRLTGDAALADEELKSAQLDSAKPMLISFSVVALLAFLCFRAFSLSIATLLTVLVGLVLTAAAALALVGTLNLLSVAFFVLFIGLAVDFGIHYTLRYKEGRDLNLDHAGALTRAATGVGGALALSAVCAAIGFFSFLPTSYVGLAELGLIAGTGMAIALATSLTVLPAFLTVVPGRPPPANADEFKSNVLSRFRVWAGVRPWRVLAGSAVVAAVALAIAPRAHFDFDPLHLKDPRAESVETLRDLMTSGLNEAYAIAVLADNLPAAEATAADARKLKPVAGARTLADFVPAAQDEKLAMIDTLALILEPSLSGPVAPRPTTAENAAALGRLKAALGAFAGSPKPAAAAAGRFLAALDAVAAGRSDEAQVELLDAALLSGLPAQLETLRTLLRAQPVGLEDLPEDLRRRWVAADGRARVEIYPREKVAEDPHALNRFVAAVQSIAPHAIGGPVIIVEAGRAVEAAFIEAAGLAILGIALLLVVLLRNLRDIALVFAPLLLAALLTVAASAAFDLPFNFANVIVLPLLFGLGVAASLNLVIRERQEGAAGTMMTSCTPRAVVFSALTTIASFGTLALSAHPGIASMGLLLAIAIGLTLGCTVIALPALMTVFRRRGGRGPAGGESA
ncbi:MAG: MMPL family transporter [Rhodospirillales bacterium]|nr:MMPL family transporter [Rhodospirillales bacterium]